MATIYTKDGQQMYDRDGVTYSAITGQPIGSTQTSQSSSPMSKTTETSPAIPSPTASDSSGLGQNDPFRFYYFLNQMNQKGAYLNDLQVQKNLMITHLYDRSLTSDEMQKLSPELQQAINTGDKHEVELQIRLLNDEIAGRKSTIDQSMKFLTEGYQTSLTQAETQRQDAIANVIKFAQTYGSNAEAALKSVYGQNYVDQLKTLGINVTDLANLPTLAETKSQAQYGTLGGISGITIPEGTIASKTNNPLNIKYSQTIAGMGATDSGIAATDGGTFAKFDNPITGLDVAKQLLTSPVYSDLSVSDAMKKLSNGGYGGEITSIPTNKKISQLSNDEVEQLLIDMAKRESGSSVSYDAGTIKDIATSIEKGMQPPDLSRLYGKSAQVRAQLAKDGFNLSKATLEWNASLKYIASANNTQQLRLRQAINSIMGTKFSDAGQVAGAAPQGALNKLRDLTSQWDAGRFKPLNRVNIEAALQGAEGTDAQKLAAQFTQQITIIQDELGQTFMGGNSPTDKALNLAGAVLDSSWSKDTLLGAIDNLQSNLEYRLNAIQNTGPSGTGGENIYSQGGSSTQTGSYDDYIKTIQ